MNHYGSKNTPFLFVISYDQSKNLVLRAEDENSPINGTANSTANGAATGTATGNIKADLNSHKNNTATGNQAGNQTGNQTGNQYGEIDHNIIRYKINQRSNTKNSLTNVGTLAAETKKQSIKIELADDIKSKEALYLKGFNLAISEIKEGNSFLLNLSTQMKVNLSHSLLDIFENTDSPYKLYIKDHFVLFSPETFVTIKDNKIFSYPIKGTLITDDISSPLLLENQKESEEHNTIVDLIRNDLSIIGTKTSVIEFKKTFPIAHQNREGKSSTMLQMYSKICSMLPDNYNFELGDIIFKLLPAGSITGAPKKKTIEIINQAEKLIDPTYSRNFYTGIFGYYDGSTLESSVMIRFIEQNAETGQYYYKSGGGITSNSDRRDEFSEILNKIYLPIKED